MHKFFAQNSEAKCMAYETKSVRFESPKGGFSSFREANCSLNHLKNLHSKMIEANQWKLSVTAVDAGKKQSKTARYEVNTKYTSLMAVHYQLRHLLTPQKKHGAKNRDVTRPF